MREPAYHTNLEVGDRVVYMGHDETIGTVTRVQRPTAWVKRDGWITDASFLIRDLTIVAKVKS